MNSGCLGGKTGCNSLGGDSLVAHYEGDIIVVVLGSAADRPRPSTRRESVGSMMPSSHNLADA